MSCKRQSQILLVEAAQRGDVDSFGKLYELNYAAMVWLAYSILADQSLAEDAAQETFAVACRELVRLRRADKFTCWLAVICRNTARQMARQRSRCVLTNDPPEPAEGSGRNNSVEEAVTQAMGRLPAAYREALVLRYYSYMSYEELAVVLGISTSKVKGRLFRARRKLAKHLKRQGFGEAEKS
ncbi:MAG: RNA polymerase sigma factor [Planctomycetota bacterium]